MWQSEVPILGEKFWFPIDKCAGGELPRGPKCVPLGHLRKEDLYEAAGVADAVELWVLHARFVICSSQDWVEQTSKRFRREW
jgi:hypothetical protein